MANPIVPIVEPIKWSKGGWLIKTMTGGYIIGYKFHYLGFFVLGVIVTALIGTPIGIGIHYFSSTGPETQYNVCIS